MINQAGISTQSYLNEEVWPHTLDLLDYPVYMMDLDDYVIRANRPFYKLIGKKPDEVIGTRITEHFHPDGESVPCPVCKARQERRDALIEKPADDPDNPTGLPLRISVKVLRDRFQQPVAILQTAQSINAVNEANVNNPTQNRRKTL